MIIEKGHVLASYFTWIKVEEFPIGILIPTNTRIGIIIGFPDKHIKNGTGHGTTFQLEIKQEDRFNMSDTYTIPEFRMRRNEFSQIWAMLPRIATLSDDLNQIHISHTTALEPKR